MRRPATPLRLVLFEGGSGDLLLVRLPASLGGSVVLLPLLALGLEALAPLVGLRVESVRVLVVALPRRTR